MDLTFQMNSMFVFREIKQKLRRKLSDFFCDSFIKIHAILGKVLGSEKNIARKGKILSQPDGHHHPLMSRS